MIDEPAHSRNVFPMACGLIAFFVCVITFDHPRIALGAWIGVTLLAAVLRGIYEAVTKPTSQEVSKE